MNLGSTVQDWKQRIWETDINRLTFWQRLGLQIARTLYAVVRDLATGQLTLRAMSLVYTTLLSIVPLLALSFSVLKALGAHQDIEPLLLEALAPLGDERGELVNRIIDFVDNMKVGILGSLGMAILVYTVISLVQKIEASFNFIWHVSDLRPMSERFTNYLSVILIGPVLVFSAAGIAATVANMEWLQTVADIEQLSLFTDTIGAVIPWLLVMSAFALVYAFIPNTSVHFRSAFLGAFVAGVLWKLTSLVFSTFVEQSTKTEAVYSGFAIVIFLLMWTYLCWMILLIGANVAFYSQHPEQMQRSREPLSLSGRMREQLALLIMFITGRAFLRAPDDTPPNIEKLVELSGMPSEAVEYELNALLEAQLLRATNDDPTCYLPGKDLHRVSVLEVLEAARNQQNGTWPPNHRQRWPQAVVAVQEQLEEAIKTRFEHQTMAQLIESEAAASQMEMRIRQAR